MSDTLPVICENAGRTIEVAMGTTLLEVERQLRLDGPHPFLAAYVNNRIKELNYRIYKPVTVRFIDITSFEGIRVYQRTISFILQKAVRELFPDRTLYIRHSLGASGFYCEISGFGPIPAEHLDAIKARMRGIIDRNLPIQGVKMLTDTARKIYEGFGMADKIALLDSRPRLYSKIYTIDSLPGYFYGALTPSTGYTPQFDLHPYYNGFFIALPLRTDPTRLQQSVHQEKMFDVFHQYQSWVEIMGVPTVGQLNSKVLAGDASELIKIAEAFHENKLAQVAGCVAEANRERGVRLVLISGPSSSGKTTFAKRLGVQLRVLGLNPVLISLDDYFVDREKTPRDENGEYDYEALEAIDLEQFNDHLKRLERGESVDIPRYDFISGTRQWHDNPLQLDERSVLIVEGIHGLNPALTPGVPESRKFKIYVSCFTSVALDNVSRIATSDNRLLRRLTRDYRTRGNDALSTLARWESVRRGEEKHIFPYQENADVMFNSSLFYEISSCAALPNRSCGKYPIRSPNTARPNACSSSSTTSSRSLPKRSRPRRSCGSSSEAAVSNIDPERINSNYKS